MRLTDTTRVADVQRLLARARHRWEQDAHMFEGPEFLESLEIACKELGLGINELAWARASIYRARAELYPRSMKSFIEDLEPFQKGYLFGYAVEHPWAP